jgi:hypothetical protein
MFEFGESSNERDFERYPTAIDKKITTASANILSAFRIQPLNAQQVVFPATT